MPLALPILLLVAGCAGVLRKNSSAPEGVAPESEQTAAQRPADPRARAASLLGERRYAEAANVWINWVDANPQHDEADMGLLDAAVAALAMPRGTGVATARATLARLVRDYPSSPVRQAAETLLRSWSDLDRLQRQLAEIKKIDLGEPDG